MSLPGATHAIIQNDWQEIQLLILSYVGSDFRRNASSHPICIPHKLRGYGAETHSFFFFRLAKWRYCFKAWGVVEVGVLKSCHFCLVSSSLRHILMPWHGEIMACKNFKSEHCQVKWLEISGFTSVLNQHGSTLLWYLLPPPTTSWPLIWKGRSLKPTCSC